MAAYIAYEDNSRVIIRADDTTNRRSRAAQITAVKRAWEKSQRTTRRTLHLAFRSYSETDGFLSRTEFNYTIR